MNKRHAESLETFPNTGTPLQKLGANGKGAFKFRSLMFKHKIIGEKFGEKFKYSITINDIYFIIFI